MLNGRLAVIALGFVVLLLPMATSAESLYLRDDSGKLSQPSLPLKTIVLTFDDGPSDYTPQILDILRSNNIQATFFVVGTEALHHRLLRRIVTEGHELGNHTYSHANLAGLPDWRLKLELGLNRLIIESQANRSTRLFRPPFLGSDKLRPQSRSLIEQVDRYGYVTAGEDIDTEDWRRPGVDQIVTNATARDSGGLILMHDGGGDRSQTVTALPQIIEYYQQRGYTFTTISGALGLSRDQLMPPLSLTDKVLSGFAEAVFGTYALISDLLYWVIIILIIASFARMILVLIAAIVQARRHFLPPPERDRPASIIVPAYNEATVITSCLRSLLASDYRAYEIIVVDDGSTDATVQLVQAITDPRLRLVTKANGGKASALNYGIDLARAPVIIAIDADTVFRPETLRRLMRHFRDARVGAVSGNTRIANRHKLITKLQSLEYVVGFNLDRRMGDLFDCITVVPGAIGAFRKSVLTQVGGFTYDTLAEDTDLTLAIKEAGHRIIYDASAVAYTEAPATIRDLLKQRFRWTFGTMQAVWKHKSTLFRPRYGSLGLIGLPYLLFFQILFPLLSPLFDLAVIVGLLNHQYHFILVSFAIYTLADILMSGTALVLDGERLSHLWLIIPQRLMYRQLMYYVIIRSLANVLRGRLVGWGSLTRQGTHLAKANE